MKFGFGSPSEKNGVPRIDRVAPAAAIPGGEIVIYGSGFASRTGARPVVHFGEADAGLMLATDNRRDRARSRQRERRHGARGQRAMARASRIRSRLDCKSRTTCIRWAIRRSTRMEIFM